MDTKLLEVAAGKAPADVVIKNGRIVNVYTGEVYDGGVATCVDGCVKPGRAILPRLFCAAGNRFVAQLF